jgi:predicted Fe-Mo cluster-binding NifX family protein
MARKGKSNLGEEMRIAVSAETNQGPQSRVAHHFGRCPYFALVEVEDNQIQMVSVIDNPFFSAHQPGQVPGFINEQSASVMISGGMGRRAIEFFTQFGIEPFTGASDTVEKTVLDYLEGKLQGASSCAESEAHGHGHDHHH